MKKKILIFFIIREALCTGIKIANWATVRNENDEKWRYIMVRDYNQVNRVIDKVADAYTWIEDALSVVTDKIKELKEKL